MLKFAKFKAEYKPLTFITCVPNEGYMVTALVLQINDPTSNSPSTFYRRDKIGPGLDHLFAYYKSSYQFLPNQNSSKMLLRTSIVSFLISSVRSDGGNSSEGVDLISIEEAPCNLTGQYHESIYLMCISNPCVYGTPIILGQNFVKN